MIEKTTAEIRVLEIDGVTVTEIGNVEVILVGAHCVGETTAFEYSAKTLEERRFGGKRIERKRVFELRGKRGLA